jgi:hypothetical protein
MGMFYNLSTFARYTSSEEALFLVPVLKHGSPSEKTNGREEVR